MPIGGEAAIGRGQEATRYNQLREPAQGNVLRLRSACAKRETKHTRACTYLGFPLVASKSLRRGLRYASSPLHSSLGAGGLYGSVDGNVDVNHVMAPSMILRPVAATSLLALHVQEQWCLRKGAPR